MGEIIFADGTRGTFLSVTSSRADGLLFVRVIWSFTECAEVFANQLKTAVMKFDFGDGNIQSYSGYTMMSRIEDEGNLRVVTMTRRI